MGILHEGHSKRKINKDPNNTKWTRDTNTFGQKILRAQGWQPGQYLGAKDAPHSELHTSANASYIRVILKDDMKGLGFSRSKEDEVTGLDVFQDLLSRLNGKSDAAVEEDRQARLVIKTHHYVEQRYGPMRFVRGGLLVGDEMKEEPKKDDESEDSTSEAEAASDDKNMEMDVDSAPKKSKKDGKSKKRKASEAEDDTSDRESDAKSKKRRKEERKLKAVEDNTDETKAKKEKKSKKDKSRSKKDIESKTTAESSADDASTEKEKSKKKKKSKDRSRSPEESEGEQLKESKKSKKEKKEKKKRRKEEAETPDSTSLEATPAESMPSTGTSTPTLGVSGNSTPRGSRNFVRSRFIAQKKQAVLDTKALAQIFMVKA